MKEGQKVPHVVFEDQNKASKDIYDLFMNEFTILFFYPKNNTPGCTKEVCAIRDNYSDFNNYSVSLFGVSADSYSSHASFISKHQLPFPLISDREGKLRKAFQVKTELFGLLPGRVTYILNKEGVVQKIIESQFNPQKHITESLEFLSKRLNLKV